MTINCNCHWYHGCLFLHRFCSAASISKYRGGLIMIRRRPAEIQRRKRKRISQTQWNQLFCAQASSTYNMLELRRRIQKKMILLSVKINGLWTRKDPSTIFWWPEKSDVPTRRNDDEDPRKDLSKQMYMRSYTGVLQEKSLKTRATEVRTPGGQS